MITNDLDWLANEQPSPESLDHTKTGRARQALLDHIDGPIIVTPPVAIETERVRPAMPRRRVQPRRYVAMAAAATAAIVGVVALTGGSDSLTPQHAAAAPLVRLSRQVQASAPPAGDATLVLKNQSYPDGTAGAAAPVTGADLYTDDGRYFYSETLDGLRAAVKANDDVEEGAGSSFATRDQAAAVAALTLPIEQARRRMADAALAPSAAPANAVDADVQEKIRQSELAAKWGQKSHFDPQVILSNHVWTNSIDALTAGAGRPEVRAGVLRLFASLPKVTVTHGTLAGRSTLVLTSVAFPNRYQEQITIDADSGIPLQFVGRTGQTPSIVINYTVTRVTAADIAND